MHGIIGFWKWLVTPRPVADSIIETNAESTVDDARFSEQLRRLYQSLEEVNARARLNSRGNSRRQRAQAVGSGIVRPA
jgi:hypothetical protein